MTVPKCTQLKIFMGRKWLLDVTVCNSKDNRVHSVIPSAKTQEEYFSCWLAIKWQPCLTLCKTMPNFTKFWHQFFFQALQREGGGDFHVTILRPVLFWTKIDAKKFRCILLPINFILSQSAVQNLDNLCCLWDLTTLRKTIQK